MLSRNQARLIWKTAFLPLLDFFALISGAMLVYLIRYKWFEENFEGIKKIYGVEYLVYTSLLAFCVILLYAFLGLYRINQKEPLWHQVFELSLGVWLVLLSLITFLFFNEYNQNALPNGVQVSRFILGTVGFFALCSLFFWRSSFWLVEQIIYGLGFGKLSIAVIGERSKDFGRTIKQRKDLGQIFSYSELNQKTVDFLLEKMQDGSLSEIYLFSSGSNVEQDLALMAERYKVSFMFSPEGFGKFQSLSLKPIYLHNYHFFELTHTRLDGWQVVLKRLFDIVFSLSFLSLFSWLYILLAILIKVDSKGSIFYLSERVGPNGKIFKLWKFRRFKQEYCTSELNPQAKTALEFEQNLIKEQGQSADRGALYKIKNDPRMTRMGKFLEKTSLDELPQFINVLVGNMSVVGPRPHQPREVKKYAPHHFKVLNIKPGITGMAQVNGRSDLNFEQEVKYDTKYVEKWSFWLDLYIIMMTPIVLFFKPHKS